MEFRNEMNGIALAMVVGAWASVAVGQGQGAGIEALLLPDASAPTSAAAKTPEPEVAKPATGKYKIVKEETPAPPVQKVEKKETKDRVEEGLCAVGIRAHYFNPNAVQNRYGVRLVEEMEEPFETILHFRWEEQSEDSPAVWWRLPKDRRPQAFPDELGIAPANILLLYE